MAVIDGTEFYCSRMMMLTTGCKSSIRLWIQGIVVLLLVVRGEFSSTPTASGKCELARVEFRNRGLETILSSDLQDNPING